MKIEEKGADLVITDFSELETYKIAIKIEKDGISFYENLIKDEKHINAKQELEFLLQDEKKHLKTFEKHLYELREKENDNFETDDLLDYMDYGIFHPYQDIKDLSEILNDEKKALRLGIALEDKSIKFYEACMNHVSSPQAKTALQNIIEEENKHKSIFENLAKTG